jgi:hypothetical protein
MRLQRPAAKPARVTRNLSAPQDSPCAFFALMTPGGGTFSMMRETAIADFSALKCISKVAQDTDNIMRRQYPFYIYCYYFFQKTCMYLVQLVCQAGIAVPILSREPELLPELFFCVARKNPLTS